jgi:hypothetical protein
MRSQMQDQETYSAKFVTFDLVSIASSETALVDKIRELLLHELFDFGDCCLKAGFGGACYVKIQWRVLRRQQTSPRRAVYLQLL